jgi:predicted Zn-dependent protease
MPPSLFPVTFVMAKEWANEMKAQSSSPLRSGAFNEAIQTMSNHLMAYINSNATLENVTLFKNNNIGVTREKEFLSVKVEVLPGVKEFATPTTEMIRQELVTSDSGAPAKKQKRTKAIDLELIQRREVAAKLMSHVLHKTQHQDLSVDVRCALSIWTTYMTIFLMLHCRKKKRIQNSEHSVL